MLVFAPGDSLGCKVIFELPATVPDVAECAFAVFAPLKVARTGRLHIHSVSGPMQALDVPPGKYELVVRFLKRRRLTDDWNLRLSFLPAGLVGLRTAKVLAAPREEAVQRPRTGR